MSLNTQWKNGTLTGTNMNTHDQLQKHLTSPEKQLIPGHFHKENAPVLVCKDGTTASIQASHNHYSTPRENHGPYTEVEVWCVKGAEVTEFDYSDDDPSAYVPIEQVVQFIDNHGGIA